MSDQVYLGTMMKDVKVYGVVGAPADPSQMNATLMLTQGEHVLTIPAIQGPPGDALWNMGYTMSDLEAMVWRSSPFVDAVRLAQMKCKFEELNAATTFEEQREAVMDLSEMLFGEDDVLDCDPIPPPNGVFDLTLLGGGGAGSSALQDQSGWVSSAGHMQSMAELMKVINDDVQSMAAQTFTPPGVIFRDAP